MKRTQRNLKNLKRAGVIAAATAATIGLATFSSCSKSSGGGTTAAVPPTEVPSDGSGSTAETGSTGSGAAGAKVASVDDAEVTAETSTLALAGTINIFEGQEAGASLTDYESNRSHFNTDDRSLEALNTVKMIMCFMAKVNYTDAAIVNKGPVISALDMALCDTKGGGGGDSGGSKKIEMVNVVVDSVRKVGKPLKVKLWFDQKDNDSKGRIAISLIVAEGPSVINPLGIFRFTFRQMAVKADGSAGPVSGTGQMETKREPETGKIVLTFIDDEDRTRGKDKDKNSSLVAVTLNVDANGKVIGGLGHLSSSSESTYNGQSGSSSAAYKLAWNSSFFAGNGTATSSYSGQSAKPAGNFCKDQNKFNMNVYQYGVYDFATKNRVKSKGGFPLHGTVDGKPVQAFASYYGLYVDSGNALPSGTELIKSSYGDDTAAPVKFHTVSSRGKLTKHLRTALTLKAIDGIDLQGYDNSMNKSIRIVWNDAKKIFQLTGTMTQQQGGSNGPPEFTDVVPATTYELPQYGGGFYSQGLGGRVDIVRDSEGNPASVAIYSDQDVTGTSKDLSLHCFQNCVVANLTAAMISANASTLTPPAPSGQNCGDQPCPSNPWAPFPIDQSVPYSFDSASLMLNDGDGHPIALASGQTMPQGSMTPNINALVDDATLAYMMAHDIEPFNAGSQDVSYSWSVGDPSNSWTMYQGLLDASNKPVVFDPPVDIVYTHIAANEISGATDLKSFGKTFHIQYDGTNLQVPGHQDKDSGFWVTDFSIKEGTTSDNGKFIFKPLEGTKYMRTAAKGSCDKLDPETAPALPGVGDVNADFANTDPMPDPKNLKVVMLNGVPTAP